MKKIHGKAFAAAIAIVLCLGIHAPNSAAAAGGGIALRQTGAAAGQTTSGTDAGANVYKSHCAMCHGDTREGRPPAVPSLIGINRQLTAQQITSIVQHGKGRMPAVTTLESGEMTALLHYLDISKAVERGGSSGPGPHAAPVYSSAQVEAGGSLFQQNCAFCHGRDAGGGETGPDLTRSKLVAQDAAGSRIEEVVRDGRPEQGMPPFHFSASEMNSVVAFIHSQRDKALLHKGSRRGVDVSDLQTGNVAAGQEYFNGAGTCARCHSATGDLAGIATRYRGLQLEERMLYPRDVKKKVTVTLPSGEKISGMLAYLDEFTVALRDASGTYRSWAIQKVKYSVDSPVDAHVDLFGKYTDTDVHNLMAYLQTLR